MGKADNGTKELFKIRIKFSRGRRLRWELLSQHLPYLS